MLIIVISKTVLITLLTFVTLSVPGRPTSLDDSRARAYSACSRCGWGLFGHFFPHLWGWSGGAMVLGKLPVPERPTILITVGQGPIALAAGAGGGGLDIFTLIYPFSPLSPSLWETARYRLKYCLKGPLNPKQPTNQIPHLSFLFSFSLSSGDGPI